MPLSVQDLIGPNAVSSAAGTPVDAAATDTATVAALFGTRHQESEVVALTHGVIAAGGGDPLNS